MKFKPRYPAPCHSHTNVHLATMSASTCNFSINVLTLDFLCFRGISGHKQFSHFSHLGQINYVLCLRDSWIRGTILSSGWPFTDKFTSTSVPPEILELWILWLGCVLKRTMDWHLGPQCHNVKECWDLEEAGSARRSVSHWGHHS